MSASEDEHLPAFKTAPYLDNCFGVGLKLPVLPAVATVQTVKFEHNDVRLIISPSLYLPCRAHIQLATPAYILLLVYAALYAERLFKDRACWYTEVEA